VTSKKSIFKLSAREIREIRQFERSLTLTDEELVRRAEANTRQPIYGGGKKVHTPRIRIRIPQGLSIKARKRLFVFVRDNFVCVDCGQWFDHPVPYEGETIEGLTLGHIIPRSKQGGFTRENLITQCLACNAALGSNVWYPGWRQTA